MYCGSMASWGAQRDLHTVNLGPMGELQGVPATSELPHDFPFEASIQVCRLQMIGPFMGYISSRETGWA